MEDWPSLRQALPLTEADLPEFHAMATGRPDMARDWQLVRALFGIHPTLPPLGTDPAKLKPVGYAEAAKRFGLEPSEVTDLLGMMTLAWTSRQRRAELPVSAPVKTPKRKGRPPKAKPATDAKPAEVQPENPPAVRVDSPPDFDADELELLELGPFSTTIFDYQINPNDRRAEVAWFCERIEETRRVFEEPMTKALARLALLNELHLRRIDEKLVVMDPTDKEYANLQKIKQEKERSYGLQWEQVEQLMPGMIATASRKTMVAHFASLIDLYRKWCADPANRPRDGVFTDDELQVAFRVSEQLPDPTYRLGWVAAVNEARLGIGDPKWKRQMTQLQCKILDSATAFAIKRLTERYKLKRPDMTKDGPMGEFDDIYTEADGEMTEPDWENLALDPEDTGPENAVSIEEPGEAPSTTKETE